MSEHPMMNPPRELSAEEQQERGEAMFALHREIVQDLTDGRHALWSLAKHLTEFSDESGWSALGYEKLGDWLADPEVGITRSTYHRLISTYREIKQIRQVSESTLDTVDPSKAALVVPAVKAGKVKVDDALEDARELGWRDLRIKYLGAKDPTGETVIDGNGDLIVDDGDDGSDADRDPADDALDPGPGWDPARGSKEMLAKPAQNSHSANIGQLSPDEPSADVGNEPGDDDDVELPESVARVLMRVWNEIAPAPKKHMRVDLRNELHGVLTAYGLLG